MNASADEERGLSEEVGMKLKLVSYEMPAKDRSVPLSVSRAEARLM